MERKPLELLILLASSDGRLVERDEIARHLWPSEVFVDTEHGINTAIRKIRYALREDAERPCFLQTVPGKGYRFSGVTAPSQAVVPLGEGLLPEAMSSAAELREAAATTRAEPPPLPLPFQETVAFGEPRRESQGGRALRGWLPVSLVVAGLAILAVFALARGLRFPSKASGRLDPRAEAAYQHAHYLWFSNRQAASGPYFLQATQIQPS